MLSNQKVSVIIITFFTVSSGFDDLKMQISTMQHEKWPGVHEKTDLREMEINIRIVFLYFPSKNSKLLYANDWESEKVNFGWLIMKNR